VSGISGRAGRKRKAKPVPDEDVPAELALTSEDFERIGRDPVYSLAPVQ
jgi:hypothetical protein